MFPNANDEFEFIPPPEAPVFEPDEEEWKDPLAYINKIYPYAVKVGICKVRPPPDWQPPFSVDVDKFRFTPRIQKLNELEAKTRVTLNFIDDIAKFWELQGSTIKQPIVEKKALNLYKLHKIVEEEGGYEDVTRLRRWSRVAMLMGYQTGPTSSLLRRHYEKILYPYDVFMSGVMTGGDEQQQKIKGSKKTSKNNSPSKTPTKTPEKKDETVTTIDLTSPSKPSPSKRSPSTPRRSRYKTDTTGSDSSIDYTKNAELKKLKFLAPGPKITGASRAKKQQGQYSKDDYLCERDLAIIQGMTQRKISKQKENIFDNIANWIDNYKCHVCDNGDEEDSMLLCDSCDASYHTFCLLPPLTSVPPGDWRCPKCLAKECKKEKPGYGFEQADKHYSLQEFGAHADKFKEEYFSMPAQEVPTSVIEKEFWRLVSSIDDDVFVEYGADLHSLEHGSGFPTKDTSDDPEDEEYIKSPWNLNNLPNHDKSVLKYISQDISGMKVPWVYIGMCFSSFCWHTEDHWTYSINYCHWGEPKTWYGVPEAYAEKLEECIKSEAPELFDANPDLFHHLVTTCSPMTLMNFGVPVVRTNQCAGEFVITFPRAYHAGFNNGYNCAEAVNFCPADWFSTGYQCVEHYRKLKRTFVFSHEELVCKMAAMPDLLDLDVAKKLYENMKSLVDVEVSLRMGLVEKGVKPQYREAFELLSDDSRQCSVCKATLFFSCVVCTCNKKRKACLHHIDDMCVCQNYKKAIRYRYTLDELPKMLENLKRRADSFDNWEEDVIKAFNATGVDRFDLTVFKDLISESENNQFPECQLLEQLKSAVGEAEQCGQVASQLLSKKHKTRKTSVSGTPTPPRLSLEELKEFVSQVQNLPCIIKESHPIEILMSQVESFRFDANTLLNADDYDPVKVMELIEHSETMDVELPEVVDLRMELKAAQWVERIIEILNQDEPISLEAIRSCVDQGIGLRKKQASEQPLSRLKELLYAADKWEEKAKICLQAKPRNMMNTLEVIVQEAAKVKIALPNVTALRDALVTAKEWSTKVDKVQNDEYYPYYDILETLVAQGRPIPVRLEQLPQMESQVTATKAWKDRAARTFIRKGSNKTLLELLRPRTEIGKFERKVCANKIAENSNEVDEKKKNSKCKSETDRIKSDEGAEGNVEETDLEKERRALLGMDITNGCYDVPDPIQVARKFKEEQCLEMASIKQLRQVNREKLSSENMDASYCLCQRIIDGFMIRCNLCLEWFHSSCITLPKTVHGKPIGKSHSAWSACREVRYFCSLCCRSRRPRLETIISLLMSLQKLPVRVAEGEAMQFLTERAMNWQDRAKKALVRPEIKTVIEKSKAEVEKISTGDKGVSSNIAQTVFMHHLLRVRKVEVKEEKEEEEEGEEEGEGNTGKGRIKEELECTEEMIPETSHVLTNSQSVSMVAPRSASPLDISSPLGLPQAFADEIVTMEALPTAVLEELENLMMEGDLLEVGLDETLHIWAILQIQKPLLKDQCKVMSAEYRRNVIKERKKRNKRKPEDSNFINPCAKPNKQSNPNKNVSIGKATPAKPVAKKAKAGTKAKTEEKIVKTEEENEEQDEDDCCAKPCQKPLGEEVGWVQCDKCEKWYHVICVGISTEEADTIDEYICMYCKQPPPKKKMKKEDASRSNSPKLSDLTTLSKMATKISADTSHSDKNELKSEVNLNSANCLGSSSSLIDSTTHVRTSIANQNTSIHTSLKKELCDPVVPTDSR